MPPTYAEVDENVNNGPFNGFADGNTEESSTDPTPRNTRSPYGARPRSTPPQKDARTRGLFDYALLAVLCAIAAMLLFLCVVASKLATGLSTMDTDAVLESATSTVVNEVSKTFGMSLGAMLLGLPDFLVSEALNGTIPKLAEQIFDTDFAEISESLEPVLKHATVAIHTGVCAVSDYDDDDTNCTDRMEAMPWLETIKGVIANLKDMPNPAANQNDDEGGGGGGGSSAGKGNNPDTIDPFGKMLRYFKMIEADFSPETWGGLHSKCVDFVDRFFEIPWDQAFQGSCDTAYNWRNRSFRPVCDCGVGSTTYDPFDEKGCNPEKCKCYLHDLKDYTFDVDARARYRAVCDSLAGRND